MKPVYGGGEPRAYKALAIASLVGLVMWGLILAIILTLIK